MLGRLPSLEELKALAHLDFSFHEAPFPGKKMLEAHHLNFSYDAPLIQDLSLTVEKGERIAIIGKNGCGKSTILRLIAEDLSPQSGSIQTRDGVFMGYFGQTNINRLDAKMTIEQEIESANPQLNLTQVRGICGLMMFGGDLAEKKISQLSGGEKSRVLLGKILAHPCNLLLLDEPTHHLDVESVESLIDAMEEFNGSCILVTHSELILNRLPFDKLVICHSGGRQQVFLGTYAEFLEKVGWEEERPQQTKAPQPNVRQMRAELVTDRSKALKPILSRIQTCEEKISVLEIELDEHQQALISHPQSKDMPERLRNLAKKREQSEVLYAELEKLILEKEKIEKEFSLD
jgi:ATP-binding cassette subfamily F protein 3